jgi:hypothetical protein
MRVIIGKGKDVPAAVRVSSECRRVVQLLAVRFRGSVEGLIILSKQDGYSTVSVKNE